MRGGELRIQFDRALKQRSRLRVRLLGRSLPQRAASQVAIIRFDIVGAGPCDALKVAGVEIQGKRGDDLGRHVVLHREDVSEIPIKALGPDVAACGGVYELRGDPDAAAGLPHAALNHT